MSNVELQLRVKFEKVLDEHFVLYSHLAKDLAKAYLGLNESYDTLLEKYIEILTPEIGWCSSLAKELLDIAYLNYPKPIKEMINEERM